ncbi:hypothetical protein ABFS82_13G062900 [Erythranthe guttata]|uniref:Uncharacterized protein n=1 Tax=Erythranthe guttata TaxID=4155 RepID=A0A022RDB8_ERYGU|nr:PREDICTED: uncharacterized protein LOC105957092 [Erythranthe guttata]EYU38236.1 hypothetical protein MIMGU_mgv1a020822mg [Erythranthe guttata]|eukprot:XP_012836464.1 PREDICTED: uncharacterized protein LOC105957092 [Erythranthe guttata]
METLLWNLEAKWKLSTQKVVAVFACTSFLVVGLCLFGALIIRWRKSSTKPRGSVLIHDQELPCKNAPSGAGSCVGPARCSVVSVLTRTVRWSPRREERLATTTMGSRREAPTPLLVKRDVWHSHNSTSAVWQRPILMGGKCELPRFSGLILYDGKGTPLHQCDQPGIITTTRDQQEKSHLVPRTTLRDLL